MSSSWPFIEGVVFTTFPRKVVSTGLSIKGHVRFMALYRRGRVHDFFYGKRSNKTQTRRIWGHVYSMYTEEGILRKAYLYCPTYVILVCCVQGEGGQILDFYCTYHMHDPFRYYVYKQDWNLSHNKLTFLSLRQSSLICCVSFLLYLSRFTRFAYRIWKYWIKMLV